MNELLSAYNRLPRREQLALLLLTVVFALFLLWVALLNPLQKKRTQLQQANVAATQSLGRVQIMTAQIKQAQAQGNSARSGENINGLIDSSLRNHGLSMSGFQPGSAGEVRVRLDSAAYGPLMAWLHELESKQGVSIRDLSIATGNNPGQVAVNLRLHKAQ